MDASVVFPKRSGQAVVETAHKLSGQTTEKRAGPADHMGVSVGGEAEVDRDRPQAFQPAGPSARGAASSPAPHRVPQGPRLQQLLQRVDRQDARVHEPWRTCASSYLDSYLPPITTPMSFPALVLRHFLDMHYRFANAVDGIPDSKSLPRSYLQVNNGRAVSHADLRLRSISFSILAVDKVRAKINWERVRRKASIVVSRLARSTPELRGLIALPANSTKPHHVLPIASGLWSRRRYVKKKQTERPEAIVRAFKSKQLKVPSIGSVEEAKELLADLLDETVRGGARLTAYGSNRTLQLGTMKPLFLTAKLIAGAQICQPIVGTATEAKTSGTLANAGAQFCQPIVGTAIEAKTYGTLANAGAQFCQPIFGTATEAKTYGTLANAGTNQHIVEAGCHTDTLEEDWNLKRLRFVEKFLESRPEERDPKRRRLIEKFCEASPVVWGPAGLQAYWSIFG